MIVGSFAGAAYAAVDDEFAAGSVHLELMVANGCHPTSRNEIEG